jgi:GR25 family glycosyltransferase involved in LPS biosynthesis
MRVNYWFDKAVVLSQPNRTDRRKQFAKEAESIGLEYEFFDSIPSDNPKDSFNKSHLAILKRLAESDVDSTYLVLEDDCVFQNMITLDSIMVQVWDMYDDTENPFDIMYWGANLKPYPDFIPPIKVSDNIYRLFSAYTTHAVMYRYQIAQRIIQEYNGQMFDAFLDEHILRTSKAYICSPFLAVQRPSHSDLWNRNVDYTDTFKASEEYLKSIE